MTKISKALIGAMVAMAIGGCSSGVHAPGPVPKRRAFEAIADSVIHLGVRETYWGIQIWDQGRNQPIYSHNADRHSIPASNTKLVVTTTAMALLGPDWRYSTPISVLGEAGDTAPRGLIVKGSGDPTMSARFFGSELAVLDSIADSLSVKGIRRINGDVIVDASTFTRDNVHSAWEVGDLPWYYAAPTAAFAVSEAAVRMVVTSSDVQFVDGFAPGRVVSRVIADTVHAPSRIDVDYQTWPDTIIVYGTIAPDRADSSWIAIPDPEIYAARALVAALKRKQIEVTGEIRVVRDRAAAAALPMGRTIVTWQSPPVKEIVRGILVPSQNWIAEQLLKTIGYMRGTGGSWKSGLAVERRFLIDVVKLDSLAFSLSDGSGLSSQNVVTPAAFVALLEYARRQPWGAQYRAALPTPGMRGGTLSSRFKGLENRMWAKTGTITNVNSLSGYLQTANGRQLTFSVIANNAGRPSAQVRRAMDAIMNALANERSFE